MSTYTRALVRSETSSAEHFGAISETFVYRVVWDNPTLTPSPNAAVASLIYQGLAGVAARPGRPLVVDTTILDADLTVRTVDVAAVESGGLELSIGCTRYNWDQVGVGDPAVRVLTTPYTQNIQVFRTSPRLPVMSTAADEFDDDKWAGVGSTGLNAVSGTAPTAADPNTTYRPAGDIGGTPIDWNGNPTSILLPMMRIEVEVFRRGGWINVAGTGQPDQLRPQQLLDYIGKRNNAVFCGFAVGTLLFDAVNRSRLDGEWTSCTFSFIYHPWRHAVQVPRPTFGTDAGTLAYEGDPRGIQHMRGVYWKQPYLEGANFNDTPTMFTTTEQTLISEFMTPPASP